MPTSSPSSTAPIAVDGRRLAEPAFETLKDR